MLCLLTFHVRTLNLQLPKDYEWRLLLAAFSHCYIIGATVKLLCKKKKKKKNKSEKSIF